MPSIQTIRGWHRCIGALIGLTVLSSGAKAAPRSTEGAVTKPKYTGKAINFAAKDLDLLKFFGAIAEVSGHQVVADEGVQGDVTVRFRNVPWDEALDIVLRTKGLVKQEIGSIIRITTSALLAEEEAAQAKVRQHTCRIGLESKVRLISVNYSTASDLAPKVKEILTPRGTLTVDERTNVLIVRDEPDVLAKADLLVRTLDLPTPQVFIEARIVEASKSFIQTAGIEWGGDTKANPSSGYPSTKARPWLVSVVGEGDHDGGEPPKFVVNMPAPAGGLVFGTARSDANLNLQLTAADQLGTIKTVSSPKAVTLDNAAASFSHGEVIRTPACPDGAGMERSDVFCESRLALTLTPHVTADGSVLLTIGVASRQPQIVGGFVTTTIERREASTKVLVKDGDTVVIGGIPARVTPERAGLESHPRVTALVAADSAEEKETYVFLTPRIINPQQPVVTTNP